MPTPRTNSRRTAPLLVALSLGYFMVLLDTTVVTVALPAIRADLGGGMSGLQWVIDGYVLLFAALLLTMGSLSDRLGARRTFVAGCALFAGSSTLAAAAPSLSILVVLRGIQGIGAAAILPASLSLVARSFPEDGDRARALGGWAAITGCALAAGPTIGGALVGSIGWRAIFLVNLPIAAVGAVLTRRLVSLDPSGSRRPIDWAAQLCAVVALAACTYAFIDAGRDGFETPKVLGAFVLAVIASVFLLAVERRSQSPMLPHGLLRVPGVAAGVLTGALVNFVLSGALFVLALAFEQGRGWSPLSAGLAFLPLTLPTAFNPLLTGRLMARTGPRTPVIGGFVLAAAGAGVEMLGALHGPYVAAAIGLALLGFGVSLVIPALIAAVVAASPPEHVGIAGGALNASRQLGAVMAVALAGSVLASGNERASATPTAMGLMVVAAIAGCLVSTLMLRRRN